jgi:pyridoxine/pyridoxamine 5'-phosphate oxidase
MTKYKDDENYVPTESEVEDIEKLLEDYYKSKEFQEQADGWDEHVSDPFATQSELDEINDSLQVKFTEDEVIEAVRSIKNEDWFINRIRKELNDIWNRKRGF